jgi:L-alanine-DL-glutamate epimerase-like enolase superfamily enzyme
MEPILTPENIRQANREIERLEATLDITNADHILLWLEANFWLSVPLGRNAPWFAVQLAEAHERAVAARIRDFRGRSLQCRTNPDAFSAEAAAIWDLAANALEGK